MSQPVGDLVIDLSLDAVRFDEQMSRVRRHFSGLETDARKTAGVVEQNLSRQALAAQKAGISVGQYKAAMRTLPAQFTDIATQLAGGQNPWLILLQQGGQVKDSFGGMIPMFRGLAGAITLPMVGVTSLAVATGALAYAWYQGDSTLSAFNKTLVLSGNQSGLTADRMLTLSRAGQAAGLTFNQASESLAALVNAGVRGGEQFDAINQSVARFASASGVEVDKVAEAFGKLTTDPTSGLMAMARQFRNVTAEQIAYVAQLQRSGDEAGALQAANDIATKGFDEQTRRLKENMGTLETWADKTGKAFKSMWDAILDIGRPESSADMLASAQKAFDEADKKWQWYQSRSQRRGKTASFRANLQGAWNDRENARLGLAAATLQSDMEKAGELAARDRAERDASQLKYTGEAQKAYERLLTPLEKYTARQEELNKALKDGKILQADYNTLMAAAKKDYESTLKKPKSSGVKVSAGERQEDQAHAAKRIADIRQVETAARYLGSALYWIAASINIKPGHDYYFYIRSVNTVGKSAFVEAVGQPSDDASGYLNFFKGEIGKTHLAQELWTQIDNGQLAPDLAEIRTSITDVSNEITQTVNKKLENQSAAIQQIQKVQVDTNNNLNSMWAVKLQQMQDGRLYIAGIGAGIENTPAGMQSQVLLAADRIAMINPANGNTKPMFVGQGDQIFMNDVFLKRLTAPTITSGGNPPAFSLTPDGKLTAKNADISGSVNANAGTLNNVTINENCQIKGKLSANQIEGDIVKTVGKAFPRDSRAPERWPSGTITVRIYDDQPFDRQIVIPAVAFSGAKHERENNDIYSSCRLIVRKNGAEIYNRTALDNTLIYSGVIDMPAGRGHMTLEFSVSAWLVNNWYPTASISDLLVVVMKKATAGISIS
ncbi:phage tail length tape measure family protein [Escherichia coli]